MIITAVRHLYPEEKGFKIDRPHGEGNNVIFVHFRTKVLMTLGEKVVEVTPDTCIFYSRSFYQHWTATEPLIHDWIHIDGDAEQSMQSFGLEFNKLYKLNQPELVTQLVNSMETEFFNGKEFCSEMCDLKLRELMVCVSRNSAPKSRNAVKYQKELAELRSKIFSDLSHNWSTGEMAAMLSLSPSRFYGVYKEEFGISPTNDLISAKINMAKTYLTYGGCSVGETAARLGYTNVYHFIRQFTKQVGVSPGRFSKNQ